MITNPSQKFNVVLTNIIDSNLNPVVDATLNPVNQINTSLGSNNVLPPITDPSLGNYNWSWNYFQFYPEIFLQDHIPAKVAEFPYPTRQTLPLLLLKNFQYGLCTADKLHAL